MEADPSLPQWKAGHLAKNYALFIELGVGILVLGAILGFLVGEHRRTC